VDVVVLNVGEQRSVRRQVRIDRRPLADVDLPLARSIAYSFPESATTTIAPSLLSSNAVKPFSVILRRSRRARSSSVSSSGPLSSASGVSTSRTTPVATVISKSDCFPSRAPERRKRTARPSGVSFARPGAPWVKLRDSA